MAQHYNFYDSLSLSRESSTEDLRAELQQRLDTLRTEGVPQADARYQQTQVAAAILGDEQRRSLYDERLNDDTAPTLTIPALRSLAATGSFGDEASQHSAESSTTTTPGYANQGMAQQAPAPRGPQPVLPFLPETATMPTTAKVMVWANIVAGGSAFFLMLVHTLFAEYVRYSMIYAAPLAILCSIALLVWMVQAREARAPFVTFAVSLTFVLIALTVLFTDTPGGFLWFLIPFISYLVVGTCSLLTPTAQWYKGMDAEAIRQHAAQKKQAQATLSSYSQSPYPQPQQQGYQQQGYQPAPQQPFPPQAQQQAPENSSPQFPQQFSFPQYAQEQDGATAPWNRNTTSEDSETPGRHQRPDNDQQTPPSWP